MPPQFCPICKAPVPADWRYPQYVCGPCTERALSTDGRPVMFTDLTMMWNVVTREGLTSRYADTGERRVLRDCVIDGVRCRAERASRGGVVIEPVE